MPDATRAGFRVPPSCSRRKCQPPVLTSSKRFRHFIDGLLSLASFNLACRDHVPTFPQRSPPSLLTTAACSGLRPKPDFRPRRALLHLSYSCAPPFGPAMLVTHGTSRHSPRRTILGRSWTRSGQTSARRLNCSAAFDPKRASRNFLRPNFIVGTLGPAQSFAEILNGCRSVRLFSITGSE